MKKDAPIVSYTAHELRARRGQSQTDLTRLDAVDEARLTRLTRLTKDDPDEAGLRPDWTRAALVRPQAKKSVHLRLDSDIIEFFRVQGKGHIARMQAVLAAYVGAHRQR